MKNSFKNNNNNRYDIFLPTINKFYQFYYRPTNFTVTNKLLAVSA